MRFASPILAPGVMPGTGGHQVGGLTYDAGQLCWLQAQLHMKNALWTLQTCIGPTPASLSFPHTCGAVVKLF